MCMYFTFRQDLTIHLKPYVLYLVSFLMISDSNPRLQVSSKPKTWLYNGCFKVIRHSKRDLYQLGHIELSKVALNISVGGKGRMTRQAKQ